MAGENMYQQNTLENTKGSKLKKLWKKLDLFCKFVAIISLFALLFLLVALGAESFLAVFFSSLSIVGLVFSALIHKDRIQTDKKWLKYLLLVAAVLFIIFSAFSSINSEDTEVVTNVETPYSADYCKDKDYETIVSDFESMGFTNVSEEPMEDLELSESEKYGHVESVSINGITDFQGNTTFKSNAKVIIKYHSYKYGKVPFSSEEVKTMEASEIIEALEKAGFVNITTDEEFDLDPDKTTVEFENELKIGAWSSFDKEDEFSLESEIEIVTDSPYEKYDFKLSIDVVENLLFSKYSVEFEMEGETETIQQGENAEFEYRLKKDEYTLCFYSVEDSSISSSIDIDLTGDTNASYKIYCYSDKLVVDTVYLENESAVGEDQAMVPISASDCMFENYEDIEKAFKKAGFTNIKTKILYDIYWGWTEEGEVDSISIDGDDEFIRGDICDKDSKIVITYHMKEEDDPNKPTETTEDATEDDEAEETTKSEKDKSEIDLSHTVLPKEGSKLADDFDFMSTSGDCAYYINVDGTYNEPKLKKWGSAIVTDGVAEYLDYLESLGFKVKINSTETKEPHAGFYVYETIFVVSNSEIAWEMTLMIQDEAYVEYELDVEII